MRRSPPLTRFLPLMLMAFYGGAALAQSTPTLLTDTMVSYEEILGPAATAADPNFGAGYSYYTNMSEFDDPLVQGAGYGWGTWLIPDNSASTFPLCPKGTALGNSASADSGNFNGVYQTIEGGAGHNTNGPFPSRAPIFGLNSNPDCYTTQVGSLLFQPAGVKALGGNTLGLAQLSNRLLTPPWGFPVVAESQQALLGVGWLALPMIPAHTSLIGQPTGNQSWTLFFNATNFTGPVAFYIPDLYTAVDRLDSRLVGTGLDAKAAYIAAVAIEMGALPLYGSVDSQGIRYRRAPAVSFQTDQDGHAVIIQDIRFYSKSAIWSAMQTGMTNNTVPPTITSGWEPAANLIWPGGLSQIANENVVFDAIVQNELVPPATGGIGLGLHGKVLNAHGRATYPEYMKEVNGQWIAVTADQVPAETGLQNVTFPIQKRQHLAPISALTANSAWKAGPYVVNLNNGSVVTYVWYRFIDQPAIQSLGLTPAQLQTLQAYVTTLHKNWGVSGATIPSPTSGRMATLDPALLVYPPAGLEAGYVPVVISQD